MKRIRNQLNGRSDWITLCVFAASLAFSTWLMFHTFSYNPQKHEMRIAFKLWSDFGAHIPMIRSFSMGDNIHRFLRGTTQYPIFPGEPIRYHFLFFLFVGILEKMGMRIDWALNIPSITGMTALLTLLYILSRKLTGSRAAGLLTVLFFLFNGSFGFLRYFDLHPLSTSTFTDIIHAKDFPSFAPWGKGLVTAFWNLNIYTNQRHLALAFAIGISFILSCFHVEKFTRRRQVPYILVWSAVLGILPYFHQPLLLIVAVIMATYFLVFPRLRFFLLTTGLLTIGLVLPQIYAARGSSSPLEWYPGYIFHNEYAKLPLLMRFYSLSVFWVNNIGLHTVFIPIGYILLPKKTRLALLPLIPLFIIPNLVKFTVEASANHKFFNFVFMIGQMCTAYAIVSAFHAVRRLNKFWLTSGTAVIFIVLIGSLTLSGIIDFFVVKNDTIGTLKDIPADKTATWIQKNTPPDAIFLNSNYLYHPASIAGRAIFLGWPYFAWSAGYKENRMPVMDSMYEPSTPKERCRLLYKYNISYVTAERIQNDVNLPDIDVTDFLRHYTPVYLSPDKQYAIFTTTALCQ